MSKQGSSASIRHVENKVLGKKLAPGLLLRQDSANTSSFLTTVKLSAQDPHLSGDLKNKGEVSNSDEHSAVSDREPSASGEVTCKQF